MQILVADIRLTIQERDDERIFKPDLERIGAYAHQLDGGRNVVPKQRVAACAVDQNVFRLEHQPGTEADLTAEAFDGQQCPRGESHYIKRLAIESKIYYRCWLTRDRHPDEYERDPAGAFWYYNGRFCGTEEDDRWITLEIKMPSLVEGWRSA